MKFRITATIPVTQYGNLQPEIEVEAETFEEAQALAMKRVESIWAKYAEPGKELVKKTTQLSGKKTQCFVGGEIYYNDAKHIYFNEDGDMYLSGSAYAKKFERPFDAETTANAMALKYNVPVTEVLAVWKAKGDAANSFGTALHKALELYGSHRTISEALGKEYHMEYHPTLQNAVESFYASHTEPTFVCEPMVVDHETKRVGQIDRLVITDADKKIGIVEDYKTNGDLKKAKLDIYWHQLSFYAAILQAAGWTIPKLKIHHWDGKAWGTYEHNVLEVK